MNAKDIKTIRWHKKSLIIIIEKAGINIESIIDSDALDGIIDDLDEKRREEDSVNTSHAAGVIEGYKNGYTDGRFLGYSDGWNAAQVEYTKGY